MGVLQLRMRLLRLLLYGTRRAVRAQLLPRARTTCAAARPAVMHRSIEPGVSEFGASEPCWPPSSSQCGRRWQLPRQCPFESDFERTLIRA
eukprot:73064-Chlamydomonas_euryale.AAC.1